MILVFRTDCRNYHCLQYRMNMSSLPAVASAFRTGCRNCHCLEFRMNMSNLLQALPEELPVQPAASASAARLLRLLLP